MARSLSLVDHLSTHDLQQRMRQTTEARLRSHYQVIYLKSQGQAAPQIAQTVGYSQNWVRSLIHRYPFDKPVAAITETRQARNMVLDVTALVYQAETNNALLNVIANNRAWGNSPALAQAISYRVLEEEEKRG